MLSVPHVWVGLAVRVSFLFWFYLSYPTRWIGQTSTTCCIMSSFDKSLRRMQRFPCNWPAEPCCWKLLIFFQLSYFRRRWGGFARQGLRDITLKQTKTRKCGKWVYLWRCRSFTRWCHNLLTSDEVGRFGVNCLLRQTTAARAAGASGDRDWLSDREPDCTYFLLHEFVDADPASTCGSSEDALVPMDRDRRNWNYALVSRSELLCTSYDI